MSISNLIDTGGGGISGSASSDTTLGDLGGAFGGEFSFGGGNKGSAGAGISNQTIMVVAGIAALAVVVVMLRR